MKTTDSIFIWIMTAILISAVVIAWRIGYRDGAHDTHKGYCERIMRHVYVETKNGFECIEVVSREE